MVTNETLNRNILKLIKLMEQPTSKRMVKAATVIKEVPNVTPETLRAIRSNKPHLIKQTDSKRFLYDIEEIKKIA